jgi:Transposase
MAETRRKFDRDFKEGAVRLVRETGKPIAQVARDLRVCLASLDVSHIGLTDVRRTLGFCVAVFMVFRSVGWRLARLAGRVGVKERGRTGYLRPGDLAVLPIGHGDRADFRRRRLGR